MRLRVNVVVTCCTRKPGSSAQTGRSRWAARQQSVVTERTRPNPVPRSSPKLPDAQPTGFALRGYEAAFRCNQQPAISGLP